MNTTTTFPIGKFVFPELVSAEQRKEAIQTIADLPNELARLMDKMTEADLTKKYRDGGWTVRQVIHHFADSHMNAFIRFKLAVTEDNPSVFGYNQAAWADHADVEEVDVEFSLSILIGVHERWAALLRSFGEPEWSCSYYHQEYKRQWTMDEALMQYEWHCRHHLEHIKIAMAS